MEGLGIASSTSNFLSPVSAICVRRIGDCIKKQICFRHKKRFVVFVSKEEGNDGENQMKLDQWDLMELKFGRHLGEDPNLTLAKIKARKVNPDASYLDVEKLFNKNKGKMVKIEEIPFEIPARRKKISRDSNDLNLIRRPTVGKDAKFETRRKEVLPLDKVGKVEVGSSVVNANKRTVPNVILRRPGLYAEENVDDIMRKPYSVVKIRENLSLKSGTVRSRETFSDMTLLKKPLMTDGSDQGSEMVAELKEDIVKTSNEVGNSANESALKSENVPSNTGLALRKPAGIQSGVKISEENLLPNDSIDDKQKKEDMWKAEHVKAEKMKNESIPDVFSMETAMQAKPKRLDHSAEEASTLSTANSDGVVSAKQLEGTQPIDSIMDADWSRAKSLLETGEKEEVEIVSASTKGFFVSFRSLIGFLPYNYLTAKWKFPPYEVWLKRKDIKPSIQSQGSSPGVNVSLDQSSLSETLDADKMDQKESPKAFTNVKFDNTITVYDQEKLKFLSSMVGTTLKVNVVVAEQKLKKLLVSLRPQGNDELAGKKRTLMAKLQVGDTVKCSINKIAYIGIFVEIEGVQALIHRTEVSWDATLDPAVYFKIGQVLEAKVHRLDFTMERIYLSLKEAMPNPLAEALDFLVGDGDSLDNTSVEAEMDAEWPEVESLIEELQQTVGIQSVSKGRFLLSPGLAPTFQVYMAAMYADQYKLLARSENKVQELIVQSSLSKEDMASTIMSCANRVR